MKILIYSDLHSNLGALEQLASTEKADYWINAGDSVGLWPYVNETIALERELGVLGVAGDHEMCLVGKGTMTHSYTGEAVIKRQRDTISPENLAYLSGLKLKREVNISGFKLLVTHDISGTFRTGSEKFSFDFAKLDEEFSEFDFVIFGHTHMQMIFHSKKTTFVNPGSAGFPVSARGTAGYALLNLDDASVELREFKFPTQPLIDGVLKNNYPLILNHYLKNGFKWPAR